MPYNPTNPVYPSYFDNYLAPMPADAQPLQLLHTQLAQIDKLEASHPAKADYAYAPGKWTVKQLVGHLSDFERVFAYRAMCIARGDTNALPGFDEDSYMLHAGFESRTWASICQELRSLRHATLALFQDMPATQLARTGTANGKAVGVEALLYIIPAHFAHHIRVLGQRYQIVV